MPWLGSTSPRVHAIALGLLLAVGCRSDTAEEPALSQPAEPQPATVVTTHTAPVHDVLVVHHAQELEQRDLSRTRRLDLALSHSDQVGHLASHDPETTCQGLDLEALAGRAPAVRELRISGCPEAIEAGLAAFGSRLQSLELSDVELGAGVVQALAGLGRLRSLSLTRVQSTEASLGPLRSLELQALTLFDLDRDSELADLLELFPRSLQEVHLVGPWAGHNAMLNLADAEALEVLEVRDTRVGNYSLHQIKPLARLRDLTLAGSAFNDHSPLYFRDLPVERFVCECPRLGDVGLKMLRHSKGLTRLELPVSRVSAAGLHELDQLPQLQDLVLHGVEIDGESLKALGTLKGLRRLELSGTLRDPTLAALGELEQLEHLRIECPELGDQAAPALAKLTRLQTLDLSGTQVSDAGLHALSGMTGLEQLWLGHTRVTNDGLTHLTGLQRLELLHLDHTDLVDQGAQHLGRLQNLKVLRLDSTLITDAAIEHLLTLSKLERLDLSGTVVSDKGVAKLKALPSLDLLGVENTRVGS